MKKAATQRSVVARLPSKSFDAGRSEDCVRGAIRIRMFPSQVVIERKPFKTEIKFNWSDWPCIPVVNLAEQVSSATVFSFLSAVKFYVAFMTLHYNCMFVGLRQTGRECVYHKITSTSSGFATKNLSLNMNLLNVLF